MYTCVMCHPSASYHAYMCDVPSICIIPYIHVCIDVCEYICIYGLCACVCVCARMCLHAYVCPHMHRMHHTSASYHAYFCIIPSIHACMNTYAYMDCVCVCMSACMHACVHMRTACVIHLHHTMQICVYGAYAYMDCVHVCVHACGAHTQYSTMELT